MALDEGQIDGEKNICMSRSWRVGSSKPPLQQLLQRRACFLQVEPIAHGSRDHSGFERAREQLCKDGGVINLQLTKQLSYFISKVTESLASSRGGLRDLCGG